jgi:hypothetical protein
MSSTSKTTSLGSPVVQNLARDTEPIINTTHTEFCIKPPQFK